MSDLWAIDWRSIIAYGFGIALIILIARLLVLPVRWLLRLVVNGVIGLLVLGLFNLIGSYYGYYLPPNPITALVVGFLGLPGLALLIVVKYFI